MGIKEPRRQTPLVTIGMPVFNGEGHLEGAIRGILSQTFGDFEVIISDNGSTDLTRPLCRDLVAADPRVRYLRQERNRGGAWNFNHVLRLCRSPLFMWAADDDRLDHDFLASMVDALRKGSHSVLAAPHARAVDTAGRLITGGLRPPAALASRSRPARVAALWQSGYFAYVYGLMRTTAVRRAGGMPEGYGADERLLLRLALLGPFTIVPSELFTMRYAPSADDRLTSAYTDPGGGISQSQMRYDAMIRGLIGDVLTSPLPLPARWSALTALLVGLRRPPDEPRIIEQRSWIVGQLLEEIPADLRGRRWRSAVRKILLTSWMEPRRSVPTARTWWRAARQRLPVPTIGGGIDLPAPGTESTEPSMLVMGWALGEGGVPVRVEVTPSGGRPVLARVGMRRPDVADITRRSEAILAGWETIVRLGIGETSVQIRIEDARGSAVELATVSVRRTPADEPRPAAIPVCPPLPGKAQRPLVVLGDLTDGSIWGHAQRIGSLLGGDRGLAGIGDGPARDYSETSGSAIAPIPSPPMDDPSAYDRWIRARAAELGSQARDLLIAEGMGAHPMVEAAAHAAVPTIWVLHERESPEDCWDLLGPPWVASRGRGALAAASVVVFSSSGTARAFGSLRTQQTAVVRSPLPHLPPKPQGFPSGPMIDERELIVCPMSPVTRGGLGALAIAFADVSLSRPSSHLIMEAGRDDGSGAIRDYVSQAGLEDRVTFLEPSRAADHLANAAVVVDPSDGYVTPPIVLAAMAAGIPTVAPSRVDLDGALPEDAASYLYPRRDAVALSRAMQQVLSDEPARRSETARAVARMLHDHHDPEREKSAWRALLSGERSAAAS